MLYIISIHAPREGDDDGRDQTAIIVGRFQSTPPARGTTLGSSLFPFIPAISIHAPREGDDFWIIVQSVSSITISIHAPREGDDKTINDTVQLIGNYFNPRPPRGGRLQRQNLYDAWEVISIHAPREGDDAHSA